MIEDDLLKKWLNDELTDTEKEVFSKQPDYAINQNIIDKAQHFKASEFSKAVDFETFKATYNNKSSMNQFTWIKPLLGIAAILLVSFGLYFTVFNKNLVEERALVSEKTTFSLPDLSQVTLNADSKINYDSNNWSTKRRVNLDGEAYFKVAKGKTFDVVTKNGTVTVVGTEFNVKTRNDYFEVTCFEGIVKVSSDTIVRQLLAGEIYRILNKKFIQYKTVELEPQWTNNKSSFKSIPLKDVFEELQRQYNIEIAFQNADTSRLFSGVFVNDNIENALTSITKPMNLTFEISSPNQVLIHGQTD
ncbi:FecR family protein [uncultured Winogradskyella sp.]|uniref:FecR family protein n=1 Tax=uncultured Winogradskyella sp. TaxID=395353 RepID=UPI002602A827|nr:FecR family protein [uncultured Winogradskyella sp.]